MFCSKFCPLAMNYYDIFDGILWDFPFSHLDIITIIVLMFNNLNQQTLSSYANSISNCNVYY